MEKTTFSSDAKTYLITGAAGFIGFHICSRLLNNGVQVIGYDNLNDYYSVQLKQDRLRELESHPNFTFYHNDLTDKKALDNAFRETKPQIVINLAAQAGVRYSIENPDAYIQSNIVGFGNVLEMCRYHEVKHLLYASSSSVYGSNTKLPFSVADRVDHPISVYAATKKSNELMAHAYSHLFKIPTTGMRFFTVYGPYGRPDMSAYLFANAIDHENPIKVFNYGKMMRDFTYVDDVVNSVLMLVGKSRALKQGKQDAPYWIYNIGNNHPENLTDFIAFIEQFLGKKAMKELMPLQKGDVPQTYADISDLIADTGCKPETTLQDGLRSYIDWYKQYYKR